MRTIIRYEGDEYSTILGTYNFVFSLNKGDTVTYGARKVLIIIL